MRHIEYRYHDRSEWPPGLWDTEPDKVQFVDEATGLPCLAVRNRMGAWCGYVGVAEGHPFFGVDYNECDADCHGGLTFSGFCAENDKQHGICRLVEPGENDRVWWLGFDCAHYGDLMPVMMDVGGHYRTLRYVKRECAELAKQLKEAA